MKPTLSIGIPTYNQAQYIEKTILSCINQTEQPFEIVVSNNHCTDNTAQILEKYKEHIRVIIPPVHLSMMENWNFLLKELKGEWFSLISSDDFYELDFVETFFKNVDDDIVLMRFPVRLIDVEGADLGVMKWSFIKKNQDFGFNFIEQMNDPKISFAGFAAKKDVVVQVGLFDENLKLYGDWGLWLKIAPMGIFRMVEKVASNYRLLGNQSNKTRFGLALQDVEKILELQHKIMLQYKLNRNLLVKLYYYFCKQENISRHSKILKEQKYDKKEFNSVLLSNEHGRIVSLLNNLCYKILKRFMIILNHIGVFDK